MKKIIKFIKEAWIYIVLIIPGTIGLSSIFDSINNYFKPSIRPSVNMERLNDILAFLIISFLLGYLEEKNRGKNINPIYLILVPIWTILALVTNIWG